MKEPRITLTFNQERRGKALLDSLPDAPVYQRRKAVPRQGLRETAELLEIVILRRYRVFHDSESKPDAWTPSSNKLTDYCACTNAQTSPGEHQREGLGTHLVYASRTLSFLICSFRDATSPLVSSFTTACGQRSRYQPSHLWSCSEYFSATQEAQYKCKEEGSMVAAQCILGSCVRCRSRCFYQEVCFPNSTPSIKNHSGNNDANRIASSKRH
jgi:hypothetical protein